MFNLINKINDFFKNEEGAETMEYVVIVAIILILGALAYQTGLGPVIASGFAAITSAMNTVG